MDSKNWIVKYETDNGEVKLSYDTVKRYLVSGQADKVTDQEIVMFINLCRYQKLNPFLREAYLIKFGNEPATIVTGKDTFTKRAAKSKLCNGYEAGVVVQTKDGKIEYRKGTLVAPNEALIGGWAKVYRKDWSVPLENTVSLDEYKRYNKEGKLMRNWSSMPATMIRKVALVQALREALPEELQGLYSPEEMPVDDTKLDSQPIEADYTVEEETISREEANQLYNLVQKDKEKFKELLEHFGYEHSADIKKQDYEAMCEYAKSLVTEQQEEQIGAIIDNEEDLPDFLKGDEE